MNQFKDKLNKTPKMNTDIDYNYSKGSSSNNTAPTTGKNRSQYTNEMMVLS